MFLPTRDASVADLISNTAGAALGGGLAVGLRALAASGPVRSSSARDRWFLPGTAGDVGLALLAIWLAVQANPGIPLFATMYDSRPADRSSRSPADVAATLVESAQSAFQLLGVGLVRGAADARAAARRRRRAAADRRGGDRQGRRGDHAPQSRRVASTGSRPAWRWALLPARSLLALAIRLPRSAQVTLATIALLSSLLATVFAPDLLFARAPLGLFNGPYGHLLNFNGLTHTVLLLWPAVASTFLFALAGRPGWGEPD